MTARHDGRDLPLGPPRRRAVLALLLIRLGRVVPTDVLIEELWRDEPPRRPVGALQSHVSHLRRALDVAKGPGEPSLVRHRTPGYVLGLAPEQSDAHRFERLVAEGRRLLGRRDAAAARDRIAEALALWQGSPYTEFSAHPVLLDERARLEQLRLTAVETGAEARLALGAAEEVAAGLAQEARRHPARERLIGHLMTALSQLGRQAEALELYERTRSHLAEEFGVDTAAELQRIRTAILRQETAILRKETAILRQELDDGPAAEPAAHPAARPAVAVSPPEPTPDVAERPAPPGVGADTAESAGPSLFAGRARELRLVTRAAAAARDGHGHVACVLGPAGVGKTRLLTELATSLNASGNAPDVVWSHCFPGEGVPPYWLWAQVLRGLSVTRPDAFRAACAPLEALLAPVMPRHPAGTVERSEPDGDWGHARFLTHDAVCEVLLQLAAARPLVLLLEDLHWADAASLDLLRLLVTRRHDRPLSIVLTTRQPEMESDASLRRALSEVLRGPRTETLRLGGLSRQAIASLVEAQAGPGVGADVVKVLHERSGGNPYFVTQLLTLLGDVRRLHEPGATEVLLASVPSGVRDALRQRFTALPEPVLRVLHLCAVIGIEVDTRLLARTAGPDEPVGAALEAAIAAGLLAEDPHRPDRLHFAHALVRETLTDELDRQARHRLHARVAEALATRRPGDEAGGAEAERLAHHSWHGRSELPADRLLPRLLRAAEDAEHQLAYEQVEIWLRRAVHLVGALPPDDQETLRLEQRLHIQLGQVLATTRGYGAAEAEAALNRGRALGTALAAPEDPSVLWALCAAQLVTGRYDGSLRYSGLLRQIGRRTGDPVALLGAAYGSGIVLHVRGRLPEALAKLEEGVATADRFAHQALTLARTFQHDPRVSCRSYDAFTHWLLGDRTAAAERRRELLLLTEFDSRPSDRAFALYVDAVIAAWEGDVDTAGRSGAEGTGLAEDHGLLYWKAMLSLPEGWARTHSGHAEDGLAQMRTALAELGRSRTHFRLPLHLGLLGQAEYLAGDPEAAARTFGRLAAAVELRREHVYLHPDLPATGLLHALSPRQVPEGI
ncbi:BTAD domain-containing putative transcriptional regulator [Streptomyces sp. bgisy084]|uniref:BTAD domain-containing putative transcriptional regulator n=1 Tax=Streptomyces sp. bgisy084 TaxID=3413777 RepID=UPI003D752111